MNDDVVTPNDDDLYTKSLLALQSGNVEDAIEMLRTGVESQDASCQMMLASIYLEGHGVDQNLQEARRLYELSVEQYNRLGTYAYGLVLYSGNLLPKEENRGLRLIKRAALMGVAEAQVFLAEYYSRKFLQGTKASAWLLIAVGNGHAGAQQFLNKRGHQSKAAQQMAEKLGGEITVLNKLLVHLDSDTALKRLEQLTDAI